MKKSLIVGGKEVKTEKQEKVFSREQHYSLSYSPEIININKKQYILNFPLRCLFEKENDYYVINNEQLDIIGTGVTQDDAEQDFNEEFDYLYNRLNSLKDSQLSSRLLKIRGVLNSFVKSVC